MKQMTSKEKAELLKDTIAYLYSKEGRSRSYISRLLGINRTTVAEKIREWNLPEAEPRHHLSPSYKKILRRNRDYIRSALEKDCPLKEIAERLHTNTRTLDRMIQNDTGLLQAKKEWSNRRNDRHTELIEKAKQNSNRTYNFSDLPGEQWAQILGYDRYQISDHGRVRGYSKRYHAWYLMKQEPNRDTGRLYIRLTNNNGISKNLQVAVLVGHAFVPGYDETHNRINHKDGNITRNRADNLAWTTQSENNLHAYRVLHRKPVRPGDRRYHFSRIVYKDKYEFKTVAALARFLGKSETQTRRYLDEPEKHELKFLS